MSKELAFMSPTLRAIWFTRIGFCSSENHWIQKKRTKVNHQQQRDNGSQNQLQHAVQTAMK
jgi:hypothetical protein